ncbi:hypothetical protein HYPSUDRAFT_1081343, partial [Hypholoma sublateritium FD-334 SS-4]
MAEAIERLTELFHRRNGPLDWAKTHFSTYEFHKFVLMMLTRRMLPDPTPDKPNKKKKQEPTTITLNGQQITASDHHKFLGVILDTELRFKKHASYVLGKGTKAANQIRRLGKTTKGMHGELARRMYYASVAPTMLYAADVW